MAHVHSRTLLISHENRNLFSSNHPSLHLGTKEKDLDPTPLTDTLSSHPATHLLWQKGGDDAKVFWVLEVLLFENLLLLVGPVRGVVPLLVDDHGVFNEAIVVQEAHATLSRVQHHRWNDRQHAHLLVFLLFIKRYYFNSSVTWYAQ